jgi:Serine hydrolase (FSH1)
MVISTDLIMPCASKLNLGFTQSGTLFHAKTRALEKALQKSFPAAPAPGHLTEYPGGISLIYPTAPHHLKASDMFGKFSPEDLESRAAQGKDEEETDSWAWWRMDSRTLQYTGMEDSWTKLSQIIKDEGGVEGVIGFSQGAAAAGMVASLLDEGRVRSFQAAEANGGMPYPPSFLTEGKEAINSPLKFAVSYSGFAAPNERYQAFYTPKIKTPLLSFIGSLDTVVDEARSMTLVDACDFTGQELDKRVIYHPGGHFVPNQKQFIASLANFIRETVEKGMKKSSEEEDVQDMDVPF